MTHRAAWAGVLALLVAAATFAADTRELVTLHALQQQWIEDQLWCGIGEVDVAYQDITLKCDRIEVDLATMDAHAEGNVILDQGPTRLSCDRMDFNLNTKLGTLYHAQGFFPPNYSFRAEELEKLDATHYRFHRGVFTSCTLDAHAPPWSIDVKDAILEVEGYGHFRGAAIKVRGVPVFYTPRLVWPVKRDRAAGFLVPTIGYSNLNGAYLGNSYFVPISRSFDTTMLLDLYTRGFVGIGDELRWAPGENTKGELRAETVRDPNAKRWEWKVQGKHNQYFPGGYTLKAELLDYSNLDFYQRFEHTFDFNARRDLYSYATLSRVWGPQTINVKIDRRKTFFTTTQVTYDSNGQPVTTNVTQTVLLERQPGLEYRLRSTRIGVTPLYLSAIASADRFVVDRPTLAGSSSRFDLFPTLSLLAPGWAWLNITPTVGARETYYTSRYALDPFTRQPIGFESKPLSRSYATAGLSIVGPSFSRLWVGEKKKIKHLIEPRIEYAYLSDAGDPTVTPVFDEKDSVLATNKVTWTLANRLFLKKGEQSSREVASFEVAQDYSLSIANAASLQPTRRGPISLWLRLSPLTAASLDARAYLDAVTHRLTSTSLSTNATDGSSALGLTWYSSYDPTSGAVTSSQTRFIAGLGFRGLPWRIETQLAYDIKQRQLFQQHYILRWKGSCWSAYAEIRDFRIPYKSRDYRIAIDLTGLGTFLDIRGSLDALAR